MYNRLHEAISMGKTARDDLQNGMTLVKGGQAAGPSPADDDGTVEKLLVVMTSTSILTQPWWSRAIPGEGEMMCKRLVGLFLIIFLFAGCDDKIFDGKNYVADHEALFDTICPGCLDLNRPLIDDMLGSSE